MGEADDRTTLGVADGVTRTYHGITGDLVEEIPEGANFVVNIQMSTRPFLSVRMA